MMMNNTVLKPCDERDFGIAGEISAGMDGQLDDQALSQLIKNCKQDKESHSQWETYHMIGDILRQTPLTSSSLSAKIARQIADEPTILAPQRNRSMSRYAMPMAASIAAVMLVSWSALNIPAASTPSPAPTLAVAQLQQDKIDQVQLADFIAAHRDFSPGASSPFVNAAYQVPAERSR